MNYKHYKNMYLQILLITFVIIVVIASFNFIVDPGNIYSNKIKTEKEIEKYPKMLFTSKFGVLNENVSERETRVSMAKYSGDFDCIVLGSSRVMQISIIRNSPIKAQCKSLLNLGVSGATIEDLAIFSHIILQNKKKPNKIFLGLDHYTLKFNMDNRWKKNKNIYDSFNTLLAEDDTDTDKSFFVLHLQNLLNLEYTIASLKQFNKEKLLNASTNSTINLAKRFDFSEGYILKDTMVSLPDGSNIYSKEEQQRLQNGFPRGDGRYKMGGSFYDINTISYLQKMINEIQKNDIQVALLLTPFHPKIYQMNLKKTEKLINIVEEEANKFASLNNLTLYGSFNSKTIGCENNEYFDLYHPKPKCLDKINYDKKIK